MTNLITAGFVSSAPQWSWHRQFPKYVPVWDEVNFQFNGDFSDCDILFVYDAIPKALCGKIKANKAIFVCSEPRNVKTYRTDFLAQFDKVLTTDTTTRHPNIQIGQVGLPWLVGAWNKEGALLEHPLNFDDFESFSPRKTKLISVISSNKAFTPQHRQRLEFVDRLKSHFGEKIDYFGRNINSFGDKIDVLGEYKYHIALENCFFEDYWTEKLADPLLTLTYPIYYGCPNIEKYFSDRQLTRIDIESPREAIKTIERILNSELYEESIPDLTKARQQVLVNYNIFALLSKITKEVLRDNNNSKIRFLESEDFFKRNKSGLMKYVRRKISRRLGGGSR